GARSPAGVRYLIELRKRVWQAPVTIESVCLFTSRVVLCACQELFMETPALALGQLTMRMLSEEFQDRWPKARAGVTLEETLRSRRPSNRSWTCAIQRSDASSEPPPASSTR